MTVVPDCLRFLYKLPHLAAGLHVEAERRLVQEHLPRLLQFDGGQV